MRLIDADELIKVFRAYALMRSGQYRESFTNADGMWDLEALANILGVNNNAKV